MAVDISWYPPPSIPAVDCLFRLLSVLWLIPVLLTVIPIVTMAKSLCDLKKMQRNQLSRLNKDELIDSILAAPDPNDGQLLEVTNKLHALVVEVTELRRAVTAPDSNINKRFDQLQAQVDKQAEIISKQQRYLETLDRKEREKNLVITGVPDEREAFIGATSDEDKLKKIWSEIEVNDNIQSHRRLGTQGEDNKRRAILLTVDSREIRDNILAKASKLKQAAKEYEKIYIMKDIHPSIRKEWKRLYDAEKAEKERPENAGCVIRLDGRERKLYRDGVVIDAWNQQCF